MRVRRPLGWAVVTALVVVGGIAACGLEKDAGNPGIQPQSGVALTSTEVDQILANAVAQAQQEGNPAVIAVADREGEVLGVYVMNGRDVDGDGTVDNISEANVQIAISKACTAAAFQSAGEAFTTRTAFFIVQGHYPPGIQNTAGGPLFGVQDSSLASSDARALAYDQNGNAVGAGISGELGGVPLFKNQTPVGGIGVDTVDAVTSQALPSDPQLSPTLATLVQKDSDERIARAGARSFETPSPIEAINVFVDGIGFPFFGSSLPAAFGGIAATVSNIAPGVGSLDARFPIRASALPAEQFFGGRFGARPQSRYLGRAVARTSTIFSGTFTNVDRPAGVTFSPATLTYGTVPIVANAQAALAGVPGEFRFPAIDGVEPPPAEGGLTLAEVTQILAQAASNADQSVAGIRLPRGSSVVVHACVVDRRGNILGVFRMGDGTLFSFDVAVQKARTAAFFSTDGTEGLPPLAMSARGIGFLAQPFFPPGIENTEAGPLVLLRDIVNRGKIAIEFPPSLTTINPPPRPPSDGTTDEDVLRGSFQRFNDFGGAVPLTELAQIRGILGATGGINLLADRTDTSPAFVSPGIQNGIQTFPGGIPLYKNGKLVGAIGVSGDGVDEDDSAATGGSAGFSPPRGIRCDEQSDGVIAQVIQAKVALLAQAIAAHPDDRIRKVYGPILATESNKVADRFGRGLQNVRIPYVKLPRNPTSR